MSARHAAAFLGFPRSTLQRRNVTKRRKNPIREGLVKVLRSVRQDMSFRSAFVRGVGRRVISFAEVLAAWGAEGHLV